jgi:hypothetical protein
VYPSGIAVSPTPQTTGDFLTVEVSGDFSSTGFSLSGDPQLSIIGKSIGIDFFVVNPNVIVLPVLIPFSYPVDLDYLAAGDYSITANFFVDGLFDNSISDAFTVSAIPVPAAAWLFGSGLIGLVGLARCKKAA